MNLPLIQKNLKLTIYPWCRKCGVLIYEMEGKNFKLEEVELPNGQSLMAPIRRPNFTPRTFRLSNGSRMDLCFCDTCRIEETDYPAIWETVKKFWNKQIKSWTKEKRDSYIENYYSLSILEEVTE